MSDLLQFELNLPMAPEAELVAAATTEKIAVQTGFDENAVDEIRVAVVEACINAIHHSGSPDRRVYLTFVVQADRLLIIVRDFGKGFDPTSADPPRIRKKLKDLQRGWGLILIRRFMDQVEFVDQTPGTELRMTKYLHPTTPAAASP
jgi:serine/threonine-protein kinase RsbW